MGKLSIGYLIAQLLVGLVALFALLLGVDMLIDPYGWYQMIPTVKFTGPANQHFIRDIGLAYVSCGALLGYAMFNLSARWKAALVGSLWLAAHGALHIWEVVTGVCAPGVFWQDAPVVIGPALLVWIGLALARQRQQGASNFV
jgi:hypothetical protein